MHYGSRQAQVEESSPSMVPEHTLSDQPRDASGDALDLPDRSVVDLVTDGQTVHGIETNTERDQNSRADVELPEPAPTSERGFREQDGADGLKTDQVKNLSVGQSQHEILSKKTSALSNLTCPHCRKVFPSPSICNQHIGQGCASLNPPGDLVCSKCGESFGTKKLLHQHLLKSPCFDKLKSEKLTGSEDGQKIEAILTQAAAEFSRNQVSGRRKPAFADDWSPPPRNDVHPEAAVAGHEPENPTGENDVMEMGDRTQTESKVDNEVTDVVGKTAIIQEGTATVPDVENGKRAEQNPGDSLVRKTGRATRARKKEHRRGDMLLVEDASKLGVDSLGKAAEVIVLRDRRRWERRNRLVDSNSEEATGEGLMFEDFLDEQDALSLDEVVKNIHGLQPGRQILSAREYKSLFNTLLNGFTILQLEKYVMSHREQPILETIKDEIFSEAETSSEAPVIPADELTKRRKYAWMIEEAHWTPYVEGAVEEAQYPLAGYITKLMPPKQRLVVQLMRECWGVSIRELMEGNGRIDIRVRDLEFKLLTREYNTLETCSPMHF
jgi:hypothetical protein